MFARKMGQALRMTSKTLEGPESKAGGAYDVMVFEDRLPLR